MTEKTLTQRAEAIASGPRCYADRDISEVILELMTIEQRRRLPDRRPSITEKILWETDTSRHSFHVTIGLDPATGKALEVFYADGQRTGSGLQHTVQDACVLISLLLQHGATPDAISKSLSTAPVFGEEKPATVVGVIVDLLKGLD